VAGMKLPTIDWSNADPVEIIAHGLFLLMFIPVIALFMVMFGPMMLAYKGVEWLSVGVSRLVHRSDARDDELSGVADSPL